MNTIEDLLNPLFQELNKNKIQYCVCGNYQNLPEYTNHDIDIWTEDVEVFEELLFKISKENSYFLYLFNKTANGSNNFFYKETNEGFKFIRIDLLKECAWKSFIPIIHASEFVEGKKIFSNFYIAEDYLETVMHFLYPLFNNGKVKSKYKDKIFSFRHEKKFINILRKTLGKRNSDEILKKISLKNWEWIEKNIWRYKIGLIIKFFLCIQIRCFKQFYKFLESNIRRFFYPAGLFIVFIGPDGSGKTTIIDHLLIDFKEMFVENKIKKFYWRPFLLPRIAFFFKSFRSLKIGNKKEMHNESKNPEKNNKKKIKMFLSFLKFFYYLTDFIFGRLKYQYAWSKGGAIVFDRYYYDNIVYPNRFNFNLPLGVLYFFSKFVKKPDLIFYLYCKPEILISRKKEFSKVEILEQMDKYENLISIFDNVCKIDTSQDKKETMKRIKKICLDYMSGRLKKRGYSG